MKTENISALGLIILAAVAGGGIAAFTKIGLRAFPPLTFIFFRFLLAGIFLGLVFILKKERINLGSLKNAVLISLLSTLNLTLFTFGVKRTTATISQMLYAGVPIVAGLFSYLLLKEKVSKKKAFGVLVGLMGVLLIMLLPVVGKKSAFNGDFVGNLLIFIGMVSYSLYSVLCKKLQEKFSPLSLTMIFIITSLLAQTIPALMEMRVYPIKNLSFYPILGLLYVAIPGTAIFYLIYQQAIKKASPLVASMTLYLNPIFSFTWAFFLLGERLTWGFLIGAALAFIGAGIVTSKKG